MSHRYPRPPQQIVINRNTWLVSAVKAMTRTHLRPSEREAAPDRGPDKLRRPHPPLLPPVIAEVRPVERLEVFFHSLQEERLGVNT